MMVSVCKLHTHTHTHISELPSSCISHTVVVDCGPLSDVDSGSIGYSMGTTYQSEATYSCNLGYQLSASGDEIRTCDSNGVWNGSAPICQSWS